MEKYVQSLQQEGYPPAQIEAFVLKFTNKEDGSVISGASRYALNEFGRTFKEEKDEKLPTLRQQFTKLPEEVAFDETDDVVDDEKPMYVWVPCVQFMGVLVYYTVFFNVVVFTGLGLMYLLSQGIFWYQRQTA